MEVVEQFNRSVIELCVSHDGSCGRAQNKPGKNGNKS